MRNHLAALAVVSLSLFACQKETSLELKNGAPAPTSSNTLLTKTITGFGQDSSVVSYEYDAQKKLVATVSNSVSRGDAFEVRKIVTRNILGIINDLKIITTTSVSVDTVVYQVNYDETELRYTSLVNKQVIDGTEYLDSVALVYNGAGKLYKQEYFVDNGVYGGYADFSKLEYDYDEKGNLIKVTGFVYDNQSGEHTIYYADTYEYDQKANPLKLDTEAVLFGNLSLAGKNNVTKITRQDHGTTIYETVTTIEYAYNTDNRPKSARLTAQNIGTRVPVTYFYE